MIINRKADKIINHINYLNGDTAYNFGYSGYKCHIEKFIIYSGDINLNKILL